MWYHKNNVLSFHSFKDLQFTSFLTIPFVIENMEKMEMYIADGNTIATTILWDNATKSGTLKMKVTQ